MSQTSVIAAIINGELVSPEGTQEGKNSCHLVAIRPQPLPAVSPEDPQDVKIQDPGPLIQVLWFYFDIESHDTF